MIWRRIILVYILKKTSLSCNILIYEKNSYLIKNYFPILNSEYQHMTLNQRKRIEYKYFSVILESSNPLIIKHSEIDKYVIPVLDQLHYPEENISNIFLNEVFEQNKEQKVIDDKLESIILAIDNSNLNIPIETDYIVWKDVSPDNEEGKIKPSIYFFDPSVRKPITLDLIFDSYKELNDYAELKKNLMNKIIKIEEEKKRKYKSNINIEDLLLSLATSLQKHKEILDNDQALDHELFSLRDKSYELINETDNNSKRGAETTDKSKFTIDDIIGSIGQHSYDAVEMEREKEEKKNQIDETVILNDMERVYKSIVEQEENSFSTKILEDYKKS